MDLVMCQEMGMPATMCAEAGASGKVPPPTPVSANPNVYVTKLNVGDDFDMTGLMTQQTHQRLTRARYPNANPEDRTTVKTLGGRDGLLNYVAPIVKPAARKVYVNLTSATTDSEGTFCTSTNCTSTSQSHSNMQVSSSTPPPPLARKAPSN
jgi:hypothetical protein